MSLAEKKVAKCYILLDQDERNKCELSDRSLRVYLNGKKREYTIERISSISTQQRKLLIPIIFSGIITPLILVGFFKGLFHPIISVVFIIGGIFSFYYGWIGEMTLTVHLRNGHRDYPIPVLTDHLKAFIEFVNQYLGNEPVYKRALYLEVALEGTDDKEFKRLLTQVQDQRRLYNFWDLKDRYNTSQIAPEVSFIVLDPLNTGTEIKYGKFSNEERLIPFVKGSINEKAVIEIIHRDKIKNLFE